MMRSDCKRFELWLVESETPMPEALKAHLERCPTCAERWQEEQRYRRLLQEVRSAPMPSTQVRWEQVQRRLAERAVQRTGGFGWRAVLAGAFGVLLMLAVGMGVWWLSGSSQTISTSFNASEGQGAPSAEQSLDTPVEIASAPPAPSEATSFALPTPSEEPLPTRRVKRPESLATQVARLPEPSGIMGLRTYSARGGSSMPQREEPEENAPLEIEILPTEPIVPQGSEQTEYLIVNYQQYPTAEQKEDALVYSF